MEAHNGIVQQLLIIIIATTLNIILFLLLESSMLPLLPGGKALKLATANGVVGGTVWPAASALCQYIVDTAKNENSVPMNDDKDDNNNQNRDSPKSRVALELGAGTGAVGIYLSAAAILDMSITLTEHKPPLGAVIDSVPYSVDGTLDDEWELEFANQKSNRLLQLLQSNVDRNNDLYSNNNNKPRVAELEWGNPNHIQNLLSATTHQRGYDLVLGSDVTYHSMLHTVLADTIDQVLAKNADDDKSSDNDDSIVPKCILSHEERLVNWNSNADMQLSSFEDAIHKVGLEIVAKIPHPITVGSKTHNVTILEIQRFQ